MITRKQGSEPEPQQLYFFLIKAAGSSALPANRNQSRDAPAVPASQDSSLDPADCFWARNNYIVVVTARRARGPAGRRRLHGRAAAAAAAWLGRPVSTVLRSAAPWCLCGGVMGCL
jgi:hypothetical protein